MGGPVALVAAVGLSIGLMSAAERSRAAFRDEVVALLARRFDRMATIVPGDPDGVVIDGRRRDLRDLYAVISGQTEPERSEAIYRAFLGDKATIGRPVVQADPFPKDDKADASVPAFASMFPPKRVKVLRLGPDGSRLP